MKKIILSLIVLLFLCINLSASIAITLKAVGDVSIIRNEKISKAGNGTELENKDQLETKKNSYAAVKFIDGSSVIKIFPSSILTINADKGDTGKLNKTTNLKVGELWAKVTKKTGGFVIDTPTTVVSVKGTSFNVDVDENGGTVINTFEGSVEMKNKKNGKTAIIGAGKHGKSDGDGHIEVIDGNTTQEDKNADSATKILEIELENSEGDPKTITIELE
jgi:hypothetical protein